MTLLPENNHKLNEMFMNARAPEMSEFQGEYLVDMLTMMPSLRRFSHRKVFYSENGKIAGHNILFNKVWGHFYLEKGVCKKPDSLDVAVINYNRCENTFITKRIRDHMRCFESGSIYIGRFHYLFMGKEYFLGYFSLSKI